MAGGTTWVKGLSERQGRRAVRQAQTLLEMIQQVGDERVLYGPEGEGATRMTRREALARVLWTRALGDGDLACAKFLLECLEGQAAAGRAEPVRAPVGAEELAEAERLLAEWWANKNQEVRIKN